MSAGYGVLLRQLLWRERVNDQLISLDAAAARLGLTAVALWRLYPWMETCTWAELYPEHFSDWSDIASATLADNTIAFPHRARPSTSATQSNPITEIPKFTDRSIQPESRAALARPADKLQEPEA